MARLMLVAHYFLCSFCDLVFLGAQDLYNGLSPWSDPKKVGDQKPSKSRFEFVYLLILEAALNHPGSKN